MQPVVVVYGQDLGGVRVLLPVVQRLVRDGGFRVRVVGTDQAAEVFRSAGIRCQTLRSYDHPLPLSDAAALRVLKSLAPNLFLGGASYYGDPTNARLLTACRKLSVPTVALLDHWKNLDRFGGPKTQGFAFAPDVLGVPDDVIKSELQELGLSGSRIALVGHPYLQEIHAARRRILSSAGNRALRRRAGLADGAFLVLCCSEMLHAHGPSSSCTPRCRALFEVQDHGMSLLDQVCEVVSDVETRAQRPCVVALRPHPFEMSRPSRSFASSVLRMDHRVCSDVEAVAAADMVLGISSMPLIQAYVLGKPVVSLQVPSVVRRRQAYSSRAAWAWDSEQTFTSVHCVADLKRVVENLLHGRWRPHDLTVRVKSTLKDSTGRAVRLLARAARQDRASVQSESRWKNPEYSL